MNLSTTPQVTLTVPMPYANYVERGEQWIQKAKELYQLKQSLKQLEAQEKQLQEELKKMSEGINSRGGSFTFASDTRKGPVQYKDIPQLKGVDLEQFRAAPIEVWKLNLVLEGK